MEHDASRSSEEAILLEDARHHDPESWNPDADDPESFPSSESGWSSPPPPTLPLNESSRYQQVLPSSLGRGIAACLGCIEGPRSSQPLKISPLWSSFAPIWRRSPRVRRLGPVPLFISSALYLVAFLVILVLGTSGCQVEGYGTPLRLSCTDKLWPSQPACGLNGEACRPFGNVSYAFRCPALCNRVRVLEPYTVGNETVNYRTLVIGGPTSETESLLDYRYRGDSFLCPAAIHAGIVPNFSGGIGVVDLTGEQSQFPSVSANGITSIGSSTAFPLSFSLKSSIHSSTFSSLACKDPRWALLAVTILYNISISLFAQSLPVFYTSVFTSTFFCVGLAADAPEPPSFDKVISLAFEGFLPAAFVAYTIYHFCVKRALSGLSGTIDQTVLWLGSLWIGALDNLTFDKLPIQRLIPHDIAKEPGAGIALLAILCIIVVAGVGQVVAFRMDGRLLQYLLLYLVIGAGILLLTTIPHLNLRIHHYLIALILLPGTALQTRPSLIYQGLLVGLFINGVARWGFASILQVSSELFKSGLGGAIPQIEPSRMLSDNITFAWQNVSAGYDSLSILVNDVERFRGYGSNDPSSFTWTRKSSNEPVYFRFAYTRAEAIGKIDIGDYSNPGTWLPNNTWIPIVEGDIWSAI